MVCDQFHYDLVRGFGVLKLWDLEVAGPWANDTLPRQVVDVTQSQVVHIVGRGHRVKSTAKVGSQIFIRDERNRLPSDRVLYFEALERAAINHAHNLETVGPAAPHASYVFTQALLSQQVVFVVVFDESIREVRIELDGFGRPELPRLIGPHQEFKVVEFVSD